MCPDSDHSQTESEPGVAPITREVLVRWKLELRDFFSVTERKLNKFRNARDLQETSEPKPSVQWIGPTASGSPTPLYEASAKDEPVDRLQAIKNRLAAQLENASR